LENKEGQLRASCRTKRGEFDTDLPQSFILIISGLKKSYIIFDRKKHLLFCKVSEDFDKYTLKTWL